MPDLTLDQEKVMIDETLDEILLERPWKRYKGIFIYFLEPKPKRLTRVERHYRIKWAFELFEMAQSQNGNFYGVCLSGDLKRYTDFCYFHLKDNPVLLYAQKYTNKKMLGEIWKSMNTMRTIQRVPIEVDPDPFMPELNMIRFQSVAEMQYQAA